MSLLLKYDVFYQPCVCSTVGWPCTYLVISTFVYLSVESI